MLGLIGYNFLLDKNSLDSFPVSNQEIDYIRLEKGIYDHLDISSNVAMPYNQNKPNDWDVYTLLDCDFNNNIDAGNLKSLENITSIKIKRRKVTPISTYRTEFDWVTIYEIPINIIDDYKFHIKDYLNVSDEDYEYALVPMIGDIENEYITRKVHSQFDGVFLCDNEFIYKFYSGIEYGETTSVQENNLFNTLGSKYPIVVSNGATDYDMGSVKGDILSIDLKNPKPFNRKDIVKTAEILKDFLKNKKAKILKDWNGNAWLILIKDSPIISYNNSTGMGLTKVSFNWVEQGDVNNQEDLYNLGLTEVIE